MKFCCGSRRFSRGKRLDGPALSRCGKAEGCIRFRVLDCLTTFRTGLPVRAGHGASAHAVHTRNTVIVRMWQTPRSSRTCASLPKK